MASNHDGIDRDKVGIKALDLLISLYQNILVDSCGWYNDICTFILEIIGL